MVEDHLINKYPRKLNENSKQEVINPNTLHEKQ